MWNGIERDVGRAEFVVEGEAGVVAAQPSAAPSPPLRSGRRRARRDGRAAAPAGSVDAQRLRHVDRRLACMSSCNSTSRQKYSASSSGGASVAAGPACLASCRCQIRAGWRAGRAGAECQRLACATTLELYSASAPRQARGCARAGVGGGRPAHAAGCGRSTTPETSPHGPVPTAAGSARRIAARAVAAARVCQASIKRQRARRAWPAGPAPVPWRACAPAAARERRLRRLKLVTRSRMDHEIRAQSGDCQPGAGRCQQRQLANRAALAAAALHVPRACGVRIVTPVARCAAAPTTA